jgi:hypothetical protein
MVLHQESEEACVDDSISFQRAPLISARYLNFRNISGQYKQSHNYTTNSSASVLTIRITASISCVSPAIHMVH